MITDFTEEELDLIVTIADARKHGYCAKGCRDNITQYSEQLGVNFKDVVRDGIAVRQLQSINNVFFNRVIDSVVKRHRGQL